MRPLRVSSPAAHSTLFDTWRNPNGFTNERQVGCVVRTRGSLHVAAERLHSESYLMPDFPALVFPTRLSGSGAHANATVDARVCAHGA